MQMLFSYLRQLESRALPSVGPPEPDEGDELDEEELELDEDEERIQVLMLFNWYPLTHSRQTFVKALDLKQLAGKL